jgi:hypothetical protein
VVSNDTPVDGSASAQPTMPITPTTSNSATAIGAAPPQTRRRSSTTRKTAFRSGVQLRRVRRRVHLRNDTPRRCS